MRRFKDSLLRAAAILAAVSFGCAGKPPSPPGEGAPGEEKGGAGAPGEQKAAAPEIRHAAAAETEERPPPREVPGDDPRAVFRAAQNAMKARDFGALFDVLSRTAQEIFHADLKADAKKAEGLRFVEDVLGFDPAEAAKLPCREAFVKVMEGGTEAAAKLARGVGARGKTAPRLALAKVVEVETEGETAIVTVEYEDGPATKRRGEVKLVLEDGKWRLAEVPSL